MTKKCPSETRVSYALDSIDPARRVDVNLRDLVFLFETLQELHGFFHQPDNYPTLEEVESFLGTVDRGAYGILHEAYYDVATRMLPADILDRVEDFDPIGVDGYDNRQ